MTVMRIQKAVDSKIARKLRKSQQEGENLKKSSIFYVLENVRLILVSVNNPLQFRINQRRTVSTKIQ